MQRLACTGEADFLPSNIVNIQCRGPGSVLKLGGMTLWRSVAIKLCLAGVTRP